MTRRRRTRVILLLCLVALASCSRRSSGGSADEPPATPSATPTDHAIAFSAYSDNDGPIATAVVTGAVGDYGRLVSVLADGRMDPQHNNDLRFELHRGSFVVNIRGLGRSLATDFATFPPNRTTCSGRVTATRRAPVVSGEGMGAYASLTGALNLTITIDEVDARKGCGPSSHFLAQNVLITGTGRIG
jgi:hypothetical protein